MKLSILDDVIHCGWSDSLWMKWSIEDNINGIVQERRKSSALTMDESLSCTKPSIWCGQDMVGNHIYECKLSEL